MRYICEIFGASRFSSFSTQSAKSREKQRDCSLFLYRMVAIWRATVDEDGHYWFAVALRRAIRLYPEARRHGGSPPQVLRQPVMLVSASAM
jgi:hypothetical protein